MSQFSSDQRAVIDYLHRKGRTVRAIASEVGCSTTTVQRRVILSAQGRSTQRKPRVVKKRLLDDTAAKRAVQLLKTHAVGGAQFVPAQLLREGLVSRLPSRQTVVREAIRVDKAAGRRLRFERGLPKKKLTQKTKTARVDFCTSNLDRNWRHVMFTDRSKFHFRYPGSKVQQGRWVDEDDEADQQVFTPSHPQCYNVYGGITVHGVTKLHAVAGTDGQTTRFHNQKKERAKNITAQEYRVVLGEGLLPEGEGLFSAHGVRNWVLQQDNDPAHAPAHNATGDYNALQLSHVQVLPDWPGNSPDLNPIENVWAIVKRRVQKKGCATFSEFKRSVDREFEQIGSTTLKRIFESMPKRMRKCLAREGDKIDY